MLKPADLPITQPLAASISSSLKWEYYIYIHLLATNPTNQLSHICKELQAPQKHWSITVTQSFIVIVEKIIKIQREREDASWQIEYPVSLIGSRTTADYANLYFQSSTG